MRNIIFEISLINKPRLIKREQYIMLSKVRMEVSGTDLTTEGPVIVIVPTAKS